MFFFPQSCGNVQKAVVRVELENPKLNLLADSAALGHILKHMEIWGIRVRSSVALTKFVASSSVRHNWANTPVKAA
jgi:hypothetical protein